MKFLSLAILSTAILLYPGFSNAEICGPGSITEQIDPGVGRATGEISHYIMEEALQRGQYELAANQYLTISLKRIWIENHSKEKSLEMCNKNIWSAFTRLLNRNEQTDPCQAQSSSLVRCKMAPGSAVLTPPPSSITCSDPSKPEVDIEMTEEDILGEAWPLELVNATSRSKPSSPTITMTFNCQEDRGRGIWSSGSGNGSRNEAGR